MIRHAMLGVGVLLLAIAARADVAMAWSSSTGVIVVAYDHRIEGFDRSGENSLWSAEGLDSPSAIVLSQDGRNAAILDGFDDRVAVVSIANGAVAFYETDGTPVAAAFFGRDLWVVLRDRSRVRRITPKGEQTEVDVALDPAFVAVSEHFVYVYSRAHGLLQEIDPKLAQVTRRLIVGIAGSDLEIRLPRLGSEHGAVAYLCQPTSARIVAIDLVKLESRDFNPGLTVAPIDLALVPLGAKLFVDSEMSVLADPGRQAVLVAKDPVGAGRWINLSIAVDRIMITRSGLFAFDSNSGTVLRVDGRDIRKIASGQTATSFVPTDEALFTWDAKARKPKRETIAK